MNDERYGPQPHDPSPFKRRCRLLQSWYRVEVAHQAECGPWRVGGRRVGSTLVDEEHTGANFISPAAYAYAREKVAEKEKPENRDLTIDPYRLFNNMLSSMPMCFNLFADFRTGLMADWPGVTPVLARIFAESPISRVESIEVEMLPKPRDRYDDKTAFDAAIIFTDENGDRGIASIETKYTDLLGTNAAKKQGRNLELVKKKNLFTDEGLAHYRKTGFDQIARNLLLTLAYADNKRWAGAVNYVLGPAEDREAPAAVELLKRRLTDEYRDRIIWLPLECVVERGLAVADPFFADHLKRFHRRYLDFGQIDHLSASR